MTTQNGRTGSQDSRQGAKPSNLAQSTGNRLEVGGLKRIAESQPTAWEGSTPDGHKVHIAYLFGEVSVEVGLPCAGKPEWLAWKSVARFHPARIEAVVEGRSPEDRRMRLLLAERTPVVELRRANAADMGVASRGSNGSDASDILLNRHRLVIRDGQLARWMAIRNRNLTMLARLGLAGGNWEIEVRFHYEQK